MGKPRKRRVNVRVELEDVVGKTIRAIRHTTVEGAYGKEPIVTLYFTDGTCHGFVLPSGD